MSWFWFRRNDRDDDLERELRSDLELEAEELQAVGVSPDEAQYAARRAFGNTTRILEDVRKGWGGLWLEDLVKDIRYAIRDLRKSPAFAVTAILSLATGIGANAAIFTVVNGILLRPLPYPDPDQLVRVWESKPSKGYSRNVVNPFNFLDWRDRNRSFTQMAAVDGGNSNLTGAGDPVAVPDMSVSPEFFSILGVPAHLGRTFVPEEGLPGHSNSVVLSYAFWQNRFGGERSVLGKNINIDGSPHTIVGVMPPGFSFPDIQADIWTPAAFARTKEWEGGRYLSVIARLRPGVPLEKAQQDMSRVASQLARERPDHDRGWTAEVIPFLQDATLKVRLPLLVLLSAVGFVLLIACANIANLLLMRGTRRLPEVALRTALGAGKRRLVQQFLSESLVLALAGWAIGIVIALAALRGLLAIIPPGDELPRMNTIHLDARVFLFSFAIALFTVLLFGLIPAFRIAGADIQETLKHASSRTAVGINRPFRYAFVITEIAFSLVLLAGAGLMLRSFAQLLAVNPGFASDHVLTMNLFISPAKFEAADKRAAYLDEVLSEIRTVPGVQAAGSVHFLPMTGLMSGSCFSRFGEPLIASSSPGADFLVITPGYLSAMRIPLLAGRDFEARDTLRSPSVVLVNDAFATKYFGRENPIGQKLNICWTIKSPAQIVGIAADARQNDLQSPPKPTILVDNSQAAMYFANLTVRTHEDPQQMARSVVAAIRHVNPDQAISSLRTMDDVLSTSVARPRLQLILLATFAGMAILLAGIGVYGVLSYSVVQRTREIGVRVALGATGTNLLRMVLKEGLGVLAVGVAIGLCGALLLTRLLRSLLFEVQPNDPVTLICVIAILIAIALLASLIPARRAFRLDPMIALRYE